MIENKYPDDDDDDDGDTCHSLRVYNIIYYGDGQCTCPYNITSLHPPAYRIRMCTMYIYEYNIARYVRKIEFVL